jgi:hypothetical protein
MSVFMLNLAMLKVAKLSVIITKCHSAAECRYAQCHLAGFLHAE